MFSQPIRPALGLIALLALAPGAAVAQDAFATAADPALAMEALAAPAAGEPGFSLDHKVERSRYIVGPGDRFLLLLEGKTLRRLKLRVLPEGLLEWEGGLREYVSGLSLDETEQRIRAALAPLMPEVEVSLFLLEPRRIQVYVMGEVAEQGVHTLRATERVSRAVDAAGGPTSVGSRRYVEFRSGEEATRIDLYPFFLDGDWSSNPYCPGGKVIFVPLRTDTVTVLGEVNRPGSFEWAEGETLGDFIAYAEGLTLDALPGSILLERDEDEVVTVAVDSTDYDMPLRPSDTVVVGSRKPLMNRVFLEGAGERLGEMYLSPGETLGDLVRRMAQTRGSAMPDQAVLERRGADRKRFFRFDLRDVLRGEGPVDMALEHDDVLYVPRRSVEVFVLGEVRSPGSIRYVPSWTVGQYLAMAGGVSERGSAGKLTVVDPDGNSREVGTTEHLHRGDVVVVGRSNLSIFSEALLLTASLAGLILSINALAK